MKRLIWIFGIISFVLFASFYSVLPDNNYKIKKVVIDAGHGGKDPGCIGFSEKSYEKDVALAVALKVGKYIKDNFKDVEVIYTRKTDEFVELYNRAKIANDNNADLFISIHCNAIEKKYCDKMYGSETYVMGLHKSQANLNVAIKENASILQEDNYTNKYDGFDPSSPEAYIIFSLYQNAFLDRSLDIASKVQAGLRENAGRKDRGVNQAGFLVLYKTVMPGILVEIGFLSNENEEKYLVSEQGQENIASSIYKAFRNYKCEMEGIKVPKETSDNLIKDTLSKQNKTDVVEIKKDTNTYAVVKDNDVKQAKQQVKQDTAAENKNKSVLNNKNELLESLNKLKNDSINNLKNKENPVENNKTQKEQVVVKVEKVQEKPEKINQSGVVFRVQFFTNSSKLPLDATQFKGLKDVWVYFHGGLYKYTVGNEKTLNASIALQNEMRNKGYKDAFVVVFNNDTRITIEEAKKILAR